MRRLPYVLIALAAAACTLTPDWNGTRYRCDDGVCPAGQICINGFCEPEGAGPDAPIAPVDAPIPPDAPPDAPPAEPDAGVPQPACGKFNLLADGFDDGLFGDEWDWSYQGGGATHGEAGGRLVITLAEAATGSNYAAYISSYQYDLTGSRVFVEVPVTPNPATNAQGMLHLVRNDGGGNRLTILIDGGQLYFRMTVGGTQTTLASTAYNAVAHRYWQVRHDGGTVYYETSPDGLAWGVRASAAAPFDLTALRLELGGGTYKSESAPGTIAFDGLNGGAPTGALCKVEQLTDDFEDGMLGLAWDRSFDDGTCSLAEQGGRLVGTPSAGIPAYCANASGKRYDLRDSALMLEVPMMVTTTTEALPFVELTTNDRQSSVQMYQYMGGLVCSIRAGGSLSIIGSILYAPAAHRWWRVREAGGTISWETSPAGDSWTSICSTPVTIPIDMLEVRMGIGAEGPILMGAGVVHFDNLNLPP